ncbi:MAG: hypothetical protein ACOCP8_07415 [archaeon]
MVSSDDLGLNDYINNLDELSNKLNECYERLNCTSKNKRLLKESK